MIWQLEVGFFMLLGGLSLGIFSALDVLPFVMIYGGAILFLVGLYISRRINDIPLEKHLEAQSVALKREKKKRKKK